MQLAIYTSRQSGATGELGTLAGELETRVRQQAEIENNRTKPVNETILNWLREDAKSHNVPLLIEADGSISKAIMPDYLHLSEKGYQIWADALLTKVGKK